MLHITSLDDGLDIFKALGSDVRIEIIKLLIENKKEKPVLVVKILQQ